MHKPKIAVHILFAPSPTRESTYLFMLETRCFNNVGILLCILIRFSQTQRNKGEGEVLAKRSLRDKTRRTKQDSTKDGLALIVPAFRVCLCTPLFKICFVLKSNLDTQGDQKGPAANIRGSGQEMGIGA